MVGHIIIADDEQSIRSILKDSLENLCNSNNIEIHSISNPTGAYVLVKTLINTKLLLITDFDFKQSVSGLDLIQLTVKTYKRNKPYIVLLTANSDTNNKSLSSAKILADLTFFKPFKIAHIKDVVSSYFKCPQPKKILPNFGRMV